MISWGVNTMRNGTNISVRRSTYRFGRKNCEGDNGGGRDLNVFKHERGGWEDGQRGWGNQGPRMR